MPPVPSQWAVVSPLLERRNHVLKRISKTNGAKLRRVIADHHSIDRGHQNMLYICHGFELLANGRLFSDDHLKLMGICANTELQAYFCLNTTEQKTLLSVMYQKDGRLSMLSDWDEKKDCYMLELSFFENSQNVSCMQITIGFNRSMGNIVIFNATEPRFVSQRKHRR